MGLIDWYKKQVGLDEEGLKKRAIRKKETEEWIREGRERKKEIDLMIEQRKKEFEKLKNTKIICSECVLVQDKENNYCVDCGHKLKKIPKGDISNKNYCPVCQEQVDENVKYCGNCGYEIHKNNDVKFTCPICGELMSETFCWNCGHNDRTKCNILIDRYVYMNFVQRNKVCPNCNGINSRFRKYPEFFNYCEDCGAKLVEKK